MFDTFFKFLWNLADDDFLLAVAMLAFGGY